MDDDDGKGLVSKGTCLDRERLKSCCTSLLPKAHLQSTKYGAVKVVRPQCNAKRMSRTRTADTLVTTLLVS